MPPITGLQPSSFDYETFFLLTIISYWSASYHIAKFTLHSILVAIDVTTRSSANAKRTARPLQKY